MKRTKDVRQEAGKKSTCRAEASKVARGGPRREVGRGQRGAGTAGRANGSARGAWVGG